MINNLHLDGRKRLARKPRQHNAEQKTNTDMKIKITKVPADSKLQAGEMVEVTGAEADSLKASGHEYMTEEAEILLKSREAAIDATIKASKAFAPKEDVSTVKATALKLETVEPGLGIAYINNIPTKKSESDLGSRLTASDAAGNIQTVKVGEASLRETVKGFLQAHEDDYKLLRQGGIIRATHRSEKGIKDAVAKSREKAFITASLASMIAAGADFRLTEDYIKATYDGYAPTNTDPGGASGGLGVINTALTLQWNLGHLENQLIMLDDITTDLSGTPVLFQQQARTRYIKVPGVQLKTATNAWTASAGNDVDVNILMDSYAGVPIGINNYYLGATARQLMNEQKAPQLYGLGEYIIYKLVYAAVNGSTRFANDGVTTSTIKANSSFADPTFGAGAFNVAGATLKTFVADLPAAMDLSKFPGGDEPPGTADLMRWVWAHTILYSSIAGDTNFQLNASIQGIRQEPSENLIRTGRFFEIGNNKFRKSQLVTDNNSTTGSGADGAANAMFVVPGTYTTAKTVGLAGTRSGLLFVSRVPLDYTKVLPEIPSTAAIELVTSPKIGITFMVVKYLDHAYETANMRAQLMFGQAIGDERQLMLLRQQ